MRYYCFKYLINKEGKHEPGSWQDKPGQVSASISVSQTAGPAVEKDFATGYPGTSL